MALFVVYPFDYNTRILSVSLAWVSVLDPYEAHTHISFRHLFCSLHHLLF